MKHEKLTTLLALLVLGVFALCLLLSVLLGTGAYRQTLEMTEDASDARTKFQYLSTKIRQSQNLTTGEFCGQPALALRETVDEECYVTYIYLHEGWLRELFCAENAALAAADGEKLLRADRFALSLNDGLLTVTIDDQTLLFHCPDRADG